MLSITKSLLLASLAVVAMASPVQLQARGSSSTVIEDNSQHNGQASGGLLGLGVNLLNNLNLGGATTGSNNQGNGNGAVSFSKANGSKSGSGSKGSSLVYEDNSQNNGQGSGGLLGLGINALNNANILGFLSGSNNQGNGNGATTIHARDAVTVEDNSQNNGQAASLIAVGANVANGDTILGAASGSNNQGNGSTRFSKAKRA